MTLALSGENALRDVADAFGGADGCTAEFLDNKTHRDAEIALKLHVCQSEFTDPGRFA